MDRWLKETPAEEPWNNMDKSSQSNTNRKSHDNKKSGKKEKKHGGKKDGQKEQTWSNTGVDGSASGEHH
ncbi:hypothetical protein HYALB_00000141 [Hymenoscyphus albidus]|uniref:Uncharacterized protein n=1 Tax=Hymenoscyphus albidus TaxID=595503 RepID=A0A9N9PSC0_9HELO|nr:hypothetical protein HYALB_00000141 [Hymenoscyphus albidus]